MRGCHVMSVKKKDNVTIWILKKGDDELDHL